MFSLFVEAIREGRDLDLVDLRKRFDLAYVKKMGVLSLPYHFWQSDPKINPSSAHMLWASILLDDQENLAVVAEFVRRECEETQKFKKAAKDALVDDSSRNMLIQALEDLLALSSGTNLESSVKNKCVKAKMFLGL